MPYKNKEDHLARARAYHHENKEAKNAYHREYAKNNREKINKSVRNLKSKKKETLLEHLGGKCCGCGSAENLQFDHIDRTQKSFTIGKSWGYTLEKLLEEADKCQLLCKECHQYKTTINHDMNMMAEGYKVKEIKQVGDEVVVTLYKPS
jgi:hypothetical protein